MLAHDLTIALRQLWRQPVFSLTAVLTLAIGIGVNAVAFTVVNGVLFKSWTSNAPENLGRIVTIPGGDEDGNASLAEYRTFVDATAGTLDLAAEGRSTVAWRHAGASETAWVLFVSPAYLSMVGAQPLMGTAVVATGADGIPSVVVGERFWRRRLQSAPLAGLTLQLNDIDVNVAGVLPESFTGPAGIYSPDVWLPLDDLDLFGASAALSRRDTRWLFVIGRPRPGVSASEAQTRIDAAVAAMAADWPDTHRQRTARYQRLGEAGSERRGLTTAAAVAMGIIGLVLLLACFNVATLLLARAVERERDAGIRVAVGASTARLVRLATAEGLVVATLAGIGAIFLAWWTQSLVGSFAIPIEQPQHIDLTPDARVIGFIAILVLAAGVLPGLWPAMAAARVDVVRVLTSAGGQSTSGRPSPSRRRLVSLQVAGSTAFLAIAALFMQSYGNLSHADMGFARDRLVVAEVEPAAQGYDVDRSERYGQALLARVRALPGVTDAALADRVPFFIGYDRLTRVSPTGTACDEGGCLEVATHAVGPGYFRTMGIALVAGGEFDERNGLASGIVINQPLARQLWPDGRGLGEVLRLGDTGTPVTVIGITGRTHTRGLDREQPTLYVPLARERFEGPVALVARTATAPGALVQPVARAAETLDPAIAVASVKTMEERMAVQLWPFLTLSRMFSICGTLALILAATGLAGVVIHAVNRRRREFGVRLTMGATPRDLVSDVLIGSLRLLVPGVATGLLLAAAGARLVQAVFVGVNVLNPATYLAVALLQCLIVVLACIGPALRASRVNPMAALRAE